jgi:hypothetical protein
MRFYRHFEKKFCDPVECMVCPWPFLLLIKREVVKMEARKGSVIYHVHGCVTSDTDEMCIVWLVTRQANDKVDFRVFVLVCGSCDGLEVKVHKFC